MSNFKSSDKDKLQDSLTQELEAFKQIQKLTEKIAEQINADKIEAIDVSLEKRQDLITKINGLHQEYDPLMQSYISKPDNKNDEIESLIEQIHEATLSCSKQNDENLSAIKEKSNEQTEKIDKQSAKRKGISGYAQAVGFSSEVIDKKS